MPDRSPVVLLDSSAGGAFGASWRFDGYLGTLQAWVPDEVPGVIAAVERASRRGMHAVGFVAYEAASAFNPDLPAVLPAEGVPLAWFVLYRERRAVSPGEGLPDAAPDVSAPEPLLGRRDYGAAVGRIREYIADGDCYQVNYTFGLSGSFRGEPLALYRRILRAQQASFCAYLDLGPQVIISASPELFCAVKDGRITACPMKGTAPRGRWPAEDRDLAARLREDPKERAENLMIVDLLRNDLGMVAETGTVQVESLFDVETYPTVHQLTSRITARLRPGIGLVEIFEALFPCGSITGAPKRRSMQIIAELEREPRGVYCGAIGVISPGGEAVFSVAIRTLVLERKSGRARLGVGSGITWDASPDAEYAECLLKSAFLCRDADDFRLIETLRLEDGRYALLDRHLQRLAESAAYFRFPCAIEQVRTLLEAHADRHRETCKVRLLLDRNGTVTLSSEPLADEPEWLLAVALARERSDSGDPFRYHKTTRRDLFERAMNDHPGCDEVLFCNERGELTEGTYHTIVLRIDGELLTPPLACGLLAGTLRQELLARGEVRERLLHEDDLCRADEIWLVNSVRGWRRGMLQPQPPWCAGAGNATDQEGVSA
ncbi:MAG: aminodeoxychorismate synthase component I [Geobacter sp.]|nr:aminodeoxychorismate synthase component I [Geobacter sp.]